MYDGFGDHLISYIVHKNQLDTSQAKLKKEVNVMYIIHLQLVQVTPYSSRCVYSYVMHVLSPAKTGRHLAKVYMPTKNLGDIQNPFFKLTKTENSQHPVSQPTIKTR